MFKKFKKFATILIVIAILALTLTGCYEPALPQPLPTEEPTVTVDPYAYRESGMFAEEIDGYYTKTYVPEGLRNNIKASLLVVLHDSYQTMDDIVTCVNFESYAESNDFIVLYIENNDKISAYRTFEWYNPINQVGGTVMEDGAKSELDRIQAIVGKAVEDNYVDNNSVYVAGFGAGGSMAINLAVCYANLYSGVATVGSAMYASADSFDESVKVLQNGGYDPTQNGKSAYEVLPKGVEDYLKVMVFQGKDDSVNTRNSSQIISSMTILNDLIDDGEYNGSYSEKKYEKNNIELPDEYTYDLFSYQDSDGNEIMRKYLLNGVGHVWSEPSSSGRFSSTDGINMSKEIADMFFPYIG